MTAESRSRTNMFISAVESHLRENLQSELPLLQTVCHYVFDSGGKRLRPGLALWSGQMFGAELETLLPAAAAVEMMHTATLLHDDIMDASPMRRGLLTVSRRWSPEVAVYAGDFILSRAFSLLAGYGRSDVLQVFSEVTSRLCRGEVLQATYQRDLSVSVDQYLQVIDDKTAHFLSCCCRVGGMLAGASAPQLEALSEYGTQIGLVFQITDDLLDYVGEIEETGKDVGADFREGKYTLPLLLTLRSGGPHASALQTLLARGDNSDATFWRVRDIVIRAGAVEQAREYALAGTKSALAALNGLPEGPERNALAELAVWIERRTL